MRCSTIVVYCGRAAAGAGGGAAGRAVPPAFAAGRRAGGADAVVFCGAAGADDGAEAVGCSVMMLTGGIEAAEGKSIPLVMGTAEKVVVGSDSDGDAAADLDAGQLAA